MKSWACLHASDSFISEKSIKRIRIRMKVEPTTRVTEKSDNDNKEKYERIKYY